MGMIAIFIVSFFTEKSRKITYHGRIPMYLNTGIIPSFFNSLLLILLFNYYIKGTELSMEVNLYFC